jgi:hypothetical protein
MSCHEPRPEAEATPRPRLRHIPLPPRPKHCLTQPKPYPHNSEQDHIIEIISGPCNTQPQLFNNSAQLLPGEKQKKKGILFAIGCRDFSDGSRLVEGRELEPLETFST